MYVPVFLILKLFLRYQSLFGTDMGEGGLIVSSWFEKTSRGKVGFVISSWFEKASGTSAAFTGKSLLEALILAPINPKYDKRLFIELQIQYMKTTSSEHVVYINCFECQNKNKKTNFCTQHVLSLLFSCTELVHQ
jgi:hypothetical protein